MNFKTRSLQELRSKRALLAGKQVLAGFDGFVDTIVTPVATRIGPAENFSPITTIAEFGQRVLSAAGKSTNIEYYPRMDKLGGNGPIMANAMLAAGTRLTYIGALGNGSIHPVFKNMADRAKVVSLCSPATTTAVEFSDGKLMFGQMKSLDDITYDRICEKLGADAFREELASADLVALVNWTMIPNMTEIFRRMVAEVFSKREKTARRFFCDLADPEKRSVDDLVEALYQIARFESFGRVTLGLNLKEAQQVFAALGMGVSEGDEEGVLRMLAQSIRDRLGVSMVVVHPRKSAACAVDGKTFWTPGPYCDVPLITTGAGDHFNAGFALGQLIDLSPEACLVAGVCSSGHYVRTGLSPSLDELETFLAEWEN